MSEIVKISPFEVGGKNPVSQYFIGNSYLAALTGPDAQIDISNVSFVFCESFKTDSAISDTYLRKLRKLQIIAPYSIFRRLYILIFHIQKSMSNVTFVTFWGNPDFIKTG